MQTLDPWRFGAAFALTVAIGYAVCTLLWVNFTGPAIAFLNALFHGFDFRPLATGSGFSLPDGMYATAVLTVWAFLIGALLAAIRNLLAVRRPSE